MREENVMKAVSLLMLVLMSSVMAEEAAPMNLEWMNYEGLMAGREPIEVHMPTEIKSRLGQKPILDLKREPGKSLQRAPALELLEKRSGVIKQ